MGVGPLIRGRLLHLSRQEHVLLLTQHHIISDGWSSGILINELGSLYSAFSQGLADPLPALTIQYPDYAAWQKNWLQGERLQGQINFWKTSLAGAPGLLELPGSGPRPALQSYAGSHVDVALSAELSTALKQLSQRHGTTLFMTLLAGWSVLLSRLSGQTDIVVGTPVANRQHGELEHLIGFFVNTLALRVRLEDNPSVSALLAQVRTVAVDAFAHQDLPFERVVEAINPVRAMSHSPLFQVMLAWNNTPSGGELSLPGLTLEELVDVDTTAQFDLTLSLSETGERIDGTLQYASELFDRATIERMVQQLHMVLGGMVGDERQCVAHLPLLAAAERSRILVEFNPEPVAPAVPCALVHRCFEAQAARRPDAIALSFGDRQLGYGELNARANQVAHHLIGLGVRPDDRVAICLERGIEMLVGVLGILKAGAAYVPLDPAYPADRLAYVLEDSEPLALLTQADCRASLPVHRLPVLVLDLAQDLAMLARYASVNPDAQASALEGHHLAYVIYTSGSTGMPKGVMVEHRNVARLMGTTEAQFGFDEHDVWTLFHSFAFDFSVWEIWGALAYGGRLVIVPALCARSPQEFYALLCRERVTVLNQTPTAFRQLIAAQSEQEHALRFIIFGGEALELHTLAPWTRRNDPQRTQLINMYGITEITVHATSRTITQADIDEGLGSVIGTALPDLRMYVLDA
ncbi:AMP-binding protein, partial [Massilia sp. CCM 9029]|nr:AMP-binding protein [Massilia sp. CCM 9029]